MKQPRQARAEATRTRILDAAEQLFESQGFAATSMSALGREAGVSAGGLYEWFASKEEVLLGIAERHVAELRDAILARLAADQPKTLETLARAIFEPALAYHRTHPRLHRFLYTEAPRPPALQASVEAVGALIEAAIARLLPNAVQGEDARRARAALLFRTGDALLHTYILDTRLPGTPEARLEHVIAALLKLADD